jgi:hypothetical protein
VVQTGDNHLGVVPTQESDVPAGEPSLQRLVTLSALDTTPFQVIDPVIDSKLSIETAL